MSFKVKDAIGSRKETVSLIDVTDGLNLTKAQKREVAKEAGEFLVESVLKSVSKAESPIAGEGWKSTLSSKYKEKKDAEGATLKPNMELTGQMLDQLQAKVTPEGDLKLGVMGSRAWIADGHNKFSEDAPKGLAPRRRFLPGEGQEFDKGTMDALERIVADKVSEFARIKKSELKDIDTKSDFWEFLKDRMEGLSRSQIKKAVLRNDRLLSMLDDMELTDWLK